MNRFFQNTYTIFLVCFCIYSTQNFGQKISISGSNTMFPLIKLMATSFTTQQNFEYSIVGKGSSIGLDELYSGKCDIAMVSRPLLAAEKEKLKNSFSFCTVSLDALCVVVHPNLGLSKLSLEELKKIYTGEFTNWSSLNLANIPIVPIVRDKHSGTFDFFNDKVMNKAPLTNNVLEISNTSSILYAVAQSSSGSGYIGYIGCGYLDESVIALQLSSKGNIYYSPDEKHISSGEYVLIRELTLVYKNNIKSVVDFIQFIQSEKGKNIIEMNGYVLKPY